MSQPGLNSHNVTSPNADTRIATLVFDTLENYTNWNSNRAQLADQLTRVAYNKAHNIISVVHETVT